jgi:hypothetical protein
LSQPPPAAFSDCRYGDAPCLFVFAAMRRTPMPRAAAPLLILLPFASLIFVFQRHADASADIASRAFAWLSSAFLSARLSPADRDYHQPSTPRRRQAAFSRQSCCFRFD